MKRMAPLVWLKYSDGGFKKSLFDATISRGERNKFHNKSQPFFEQERKALQAVLHVNEVVGRWVSFCQKENTTRSKFTRRALQHYYAVQTKSGRDNILSDFIERQTEAATTTKLEHVMSRLRSFNFSGKKSCDSTKISMHRRNFTFVMVQTDWKKEATMSFIETQSSNNKLEHRIGSYGLANDTLQKMRHHPVISNGNHRWRNKLLM